MRHVVLAGMCALALVVSAQPASAEVRPETPAASAVARRAPATSETATIGGREVDIWRPAGRGPAPIIIFSHGFLGCGRQSTVLTQALADAGYLVVAPQHADSLCGHHLNPPEVPFWLPQDWTDATYRDRRDDIVAVIAGLHKDPRFAGQIDWSKLGLMGQSLGGYTVLGLAGGWPGWRLPEVKAVVALSPWCLPFISSPAERSGPHVSAPIEYQGGTTDLFITPSVSQHGGCYERDAGFPATFVEFRDAGHLAWTDMVALTDHADMILYARAFFDTWLLGRPPDMLRTRRGDVTDLRNK